MQNWRLVTVEPARRLRFSVFILPLLSALACEVRAEVDESEIRRAIERGELLRENPSPASGIAQSHAWILKIDGVRCGHARVSVEAEGKAYRVRGVLKTAMPAGDGDAINTQSYDFLLDTDLALLSGTIVRSFGKTNPVAFEAWTRTAAFKVEDGQLHWKRNEQRHDGTPASAGISRQWNLHGLRPIPEQALFLLGTLASTRCMPRRDQRLCIPTFTTAGDLEVPDVQPAWLEFGGSVFGKPKPDRINLILGYYFSGRIAEDGWHVRDPEPVAAWPSEWIMDASGRLLRQPRVLFLEHWEGLDPKDLDESEPLDFEKIKAALTRLNATMKNSEQEYKDRPEKLNDLLSELFGD